MNKQKTILWLDDLRNPFINKERLPKEDGVIHWVLNYKEFKEYIELNGLPDVISFDQDLHEEHYTPEYFWLDYDASKEFQDWKKHTYKHETGEDCAKFLVKFCLFRELEMPKTYIHSANPVGVKYIEKILI